MALLHDRRQHHLRLPRPRAQRTASVSRMGISRGTSAIRRRRSGAALFHVYRQTTPRSGGDTGDDAGDPGGSAGVLVFCETEEENNLTTKDTKELFLKSRVEREIPLVARH